MVSTTARVFVARVSDLQLHRRAGWRADVERARTALGARCLTVHVPEATWRRHYLAGLDPAGAVALELQRMAD